MAVLASRRADLREYTQALSKGRGGEYLAERGYRNVIPASGYGPEFQANPQNPRGEGFVGQVLGAQAPSGGGGGEGRREQLAKTNRNPPQESEYQSLLQQTPAAPQIDFDAMIRPAIEGLEAAIGPLTQGYETFRTGEEANLGTQIARTGQNISEQSATLEQGRTRQQQGAESAVDEARRQFAEIQQGLQGRYGRTTGTGAFAAELAGRETLGNIANVRQGLSNAMLEIDNKLAQVKEIGRIAIEDANNQSRDRIAQARNQLDLAIADIRKQQGTLQADKARLAQQAIQWYQGEVNRVESENKQFLQNMYVRQKEAENQLNLANQRAQTTAESFNVMNLSQGNQTTPVRVGSRGTMLNFAGQPVNVGSNAALYETGAYRRPEEEQLLPEGL